MHAVAFLKHPEKRGFSRNVKKRSTTQFVPLCVKNSGHRYNYCHDGRTKHVYAHSSLYITVPITDSYEFVSETGEKRGERNAIVPSQTRHVRRGALATRARTYVNSRNSFNDASRVLADD